MLRRFQRIAGAMLIFIFAASCGTQLSSRQLVAAAIQAMGGIEKLQNMQAIVRKGSGTRTNLGQAQSIGGTEPVAQVRNYVEAVDIRNREAVLQYDIHLGDFTQRRREVFSKFGEGVERKPVGYYLVDGRAAAVSPAALVSYSAFDSPEQSLRRGITTILLAAAESAVTAQTVRQAEFNGKMCNFGEAKTINDESMTMYFDPETKLLEGFEITETDTVLGDIPVEYIFEDYRKVGDVLLPHHLKIRRNKADSAELRFDSITTSLGETSDWFTMPEETREDAKKSTVNPFMPIKITRLAPGVFLAEGFTHHSFIVEMPDYMVVVEAPQSDAWARVLFIEARKLAPKKDIRYVVVTHPHSDHIGGIRGLVARGATVLVEKRHEPLIRTLLESRHGRLRDELQDARDGKKTVGGIEVFEEKKEITNKGRTLELYAIPDSPHAAPMVVAYLRRERILFQSDLFPAAPQIASHLYASIMKLNLQADRIVGGHGSPAPISELAKMSRTSS